MTGFVADHAGAEVRVSPNFGPRRDVSRPDMIILHYTGMETGDSAEAWLCNPESEVSSHYLVHEDGRVVQMVRERDRAWHAGRGSWQGTTDINSRSIGIEIVNPGNLADHPPFAAVQIEAVIALCRDLCARHGISPDKVLAHSDVSPGRKIDPGPAFPWERLAAEGIGITAGNVEVLPFEPLTLGSEGERVELIQSMLALYGYGIEISAVYDDWTATVVRSFQLHFRRGLADGVVDAETFAVLNALLRRMPALTQG